MGRNADARTHTPHPMRQTQGTCRPTFSEGTVSPGRYASQTRYEPDCTRHNVIRCKTREGLRGKWRRPSQRVTKAFRLLTLTTAANIADLNKQKRRQRKQRTRCASSVQRAGTQRMMRLQKKERGQEAHLRWSVTKDHDKNKHNDWRLLQRA
jgi:hypothetical protein